MVVHDTCINVANRELLPCQVKIRVQLNFANISWYTVHVRTCTTAKTVQTDKHAGM